MYSAYLLAKKDYKLIFSALYHSQLTVLCANHNHLCSVKTEKVGYLYFLKYSI